MSKCHVVPFQRWIQYFSRGKEVGSTLGLKRKDCCPQNVSILRIGTQFKTVTTQILAIPQSRNYNEITVRSVSCHSAIIFKLYFNFYCLLFQ